MLLSLCIVVMSPMTVRAWNDLGHMTVARIAYDQLSDAERSAIVGMLRPHPHLREILLKDRPAHVSEDEWLFMRAATWPDHVRPPRVSSHEPVKSHPIYRFHHATWHYADFEYQAGQRESTLPRKPLPHHPSLHNPADQTNIIEQLDHSYLIVRGTEREYSEPEIGLAPSELRAVRLCWLFHLIGDIHQPLHIATLTDHRVPQLQHGDEGGNKLAIRIDHSTAPRKLHAFWDDQLGTHANYNKVVSLAERLSRDPRLNPARTPAFQNHKLAWQFAEESYQIAKQSVYLDGHLQFALWSKVESHELRETDVPVISPQAITQAHEIAEGRIALAGFRLAERLKFIVFRDPSHGGSAQGMAAPVRRDRPPTRYVR